jgi:signal transduction histidine kinase
VVPLLAHDALVGVITLISSTVSYAPTDLRIAEELGRRAAQAIENARLYQAARRATQARDELLGIVAHDLRNPLSSIALQAELLCERGDASVRPAAERIASNASRLSRLIQDLLDVTRMEAGQLSVEAARVSAQHLVSDAGEAQRALAAASGLELQIELPSAIPDVWADRDRLLQILENLIGNAIKFTPRGGRITIGAMPRDGTVVFWVADTGEGIALEDQPHVFERFWQASKAKHRGAGLGLPIVKGLVEAHGGHVWVESTPGRGSAFFFTIPTAALIEHRDLAPSSH